MTVFIYYTQDISKYMLLLFCHLNIYNREKSLARKFFLFKNI